MIILKLYYLIFYTICSIQVSNSQHVTVPVQAYPIYQQTPYNDAQQNVPLIVHPSNNNNHYTNANTAQNIIPNDFATILMNQILASPSVYKYIDPTTRHCRQSDIEVPHHGCVTTGSVPHVTNNYFIVPPEYLKLNNSETASAKVAPQLFKRVENSVIVIPPDKHNEINNVGTETVIVKNNTKNSSQGQRKRRRKIPRQGKKNKASSSKPVNHSKNDNNNRVRSTEAVSNQKLEDKDSISSKILFDDSVRQINNSKNIQTQLNNTENDNRKRRRSKNKRKDNAVSAHVDKSNSEEISLNIDTIAKTEQALQKTTQDNSKEVEKQIETNYLNTLQIFSNKNPISFGDKSVAKFKSDDSRVTRNSEDDMIIREFKQKFPEAPESLVRNMLTYIQNQFQNNLGTNLFYPGSIPFGFEQFFQIPQISNQDYPHRNVHKRKHKHRKRKQNQRKASSNRRRKNRKNKGIVSKSSKLTNDSEIANSTTEPERSNEKLIMDNQPLAEVQPSTDIIKNSSEETAEVNQEKVTYPVHNQFKKETELFKTEVSLEEVEINYNIEDPYTQEICEDEDSVPTIYNNRFVDDYYPTFIDDVGPFGTDEYNVRNLNDRYYYTTDHNRNSIYKEETNKPYIYEEIKKPRRTFKDEIPKLLNYNFKDNDLKHTYFDADREGLRNLVKELPKQLPLLKSRAETPLTVSKEETDLKSAPALEFPDFITKKIDKSMKLQEYKTRNDKQNEDIVVDLSVPSKLDYYSNVLREDGVRNVMKPQEHAKGIETVYAKSKVVKYGADRDNEKSSYHPADDDDEEHISYVLAKSLASSDVIY